MLLVHHKNFYYLSTPNFFVIVFVIILPLFIPETLAAILVYLLKFGNKHQCKDGKCTHFIC